MSEIKNIIFNDDLVKSDIFDKYIRLEDELRQLHKVAIAFSGGVDSTFLLNTAKKVLEKNVLAITLVTDAFPKNEKEFAKKFCRENNIEQIELNIDIFEVDEFAENTKDRCYYCKKNMFEKILLAAKEKGFDIVCEGSNQSDMSDYRPGLKALEELCIYSPLRKALLLKDEIRQLSKKDGILIWDKPSFACLASRVMYGERITKEKLEKIGYCEKVLLELGFKQYRVRMHGNLARIEIYKEDFGRILEEDVRMKIMSSFQKAGFTYVTLDMQGFRSGSMNDMLTIRA
ncbi:ATP-dependent sacrificial sulfur transferase LarE [Butyrivibrio sp. NC3005]|uniref:ATP-dependent sacrificial sulfur transferase LarE n=1 Tax=Butyrivibrio sp. NC3005 TaxID=1280685 RepID=UPI000424D3A0|nr:ATP-dependent sacrificial sulfur transferase LarE [Butyrivibrio sp. NC3005]